MFKIEVDRFARSLVDHLLDEGDVVRMNPLKHHLQCRLQLPIVTQHIERFLGPDQLSGRNIPAEAAGLTEFLGLGQITLAAAQSFLGARALDSNAAQVCELLQEITLARCWAARCAAIDGKRSEDLTIKGTYRRRPD